MKYKTILANPPWKWEAYSAKDDGRSEAKKGIEVTASTPLGS